MEHERLLSRLEIVKAISIMKYVICRIFWSCCGTKNIEHALAKDFVFSIFGSF